MNEGLGEKSVMVLGLIADGHSYSQIVDGDPDLSYHDIFFAAEEALRSNGSYTDHQGRLAEIKSRYPRAYEPWTRKDDRDLIALQAQMDGSEDLAVRFQRQPSAILAHLARVNSRSGSLSEADRRQ